MGTNDNEALVARCLSEAAGMIRHELYVSAAIELGVAYGYIREWARREGKLTMEHDHWEILNALLRLLGLVGWVSPIEPEAVLRGQCLEGPSEPDAPQENDDDCALDDACYWGDDFGDQTGMAHIQDAIDSAAQAQSDQMWDTEAYYLDLAWARLSSACLGEIGLIEAHPCWDAYRKVALLAAARCGMDIRREMGEYAKRI